MRPILFAPDTFEPRRVPAPAVQTPLGVVELGCTVGETPLSSLATEAATGTTPDGQLLLWESPDLRAELQLTPMPAESAPDESGCVLAVWRIRALATTPPVTFSIGWSIGASWVDGGGDTGECLEALSYWDARVAMGGDTSATVEVTFGTTAGECFAGAVGEWWPERWTWKVFGCDYMDCSDLIRYGTHHLAVPLPAFESGEQATVRFAVAWGSPEPMATSPRMRIDDVLWKANRAFWKTHRSRA